MLIEISDLVEGEEQKAQFKAAVDAAKKTRVTQDKIALVKDVLPSSLRPGGMNPLSALHEVLSEGLHARSDSDCMELSSNVRKILVFLVNQTATTKVARDDFMDGMKKVLERKSKNAG